MYMIHEYYCPVCKTISCPSAGKYDRIEGVQRHTEICETCADAIRFVKKNRTALEAIIRLHVDTSEPGYILMPEGDAGHGQ